MSPLMDKVAPAFVAAQAEIKGAFKDCVNPFHKSNYADLESVWLACREALNKQGLAIMQNFESIGGKIHLITLLLHSSGQFIASELELPFPFEIEDRTGKRTLKNDPQSLGATMTYCRRFALAAMMEIVQTDDDGQSLMDQQRKEAESSRLQPMSKQSVKVQPKEKAISKSKETHANETPFDSPLATLKEAFKMRGVDTSHLGEFLASRAVQKQTTPEKIIDSALLNPDMTAKFIQVFLSWCEGDQPTA